MKTVKPSRILAIILAAVLAIGMAGCADTSAQNAPSSQTAPPAQTAAPAQNEPEAPAEPGSLVIMAPTEIKEYLDTLKPGFEAETGIELFVIAREQGDINQGIPLDGPAGIGPDVFFSNYNRLAGFVDSELVDEYPLPEGRYSDLVAEKTTIDGKTYGAPINMDSYFLIYNKDLLPEPPKTFAELEALSEDPFYAEGDRSTAFLAPFIAPAIFQGILVGFGGYIFGDNGKNPDDIGLNSPGAIEAARYVKSWFDRWPAGMIDPRADILIKDLFIAGKTAAYIGGSWDWGQVQDSGINLGAAKIPTLPNGNETMYDSGGRGWFLSNYSKNKEGARLLMDYLTTEENQELLFDMASLIAASAAAQENLKKRNDQMVNAVVEQTQFSVPMPKIPEISEYNALFFDVYFEIFAGTKDIQQGLDDGVQSYRDIIQQKYR